MSENDIRLLRNQYLTHPLLPGIVFGGMYIVMLCIAMLSDISEMLGLLIILTPVVGCVFVKTLLEYQLETANYPRILKYMSNNNHIVIALPDEWILSSEKNFISVMDSNDVLYIAGAIINFDNAARLTTICMNNIFTITPQQTSVGIIDELYPCTVSVNGKSRKCYAVYRMLSNNLACALYFFNVKKMDIDTIHDICYSINVAS